MSQNEFVENTVVTEIGKDLGANMLTQKFSPEKTAEKCLEILKTRGITADWLCSQYNLDAMMGIAKAKGMPEAIKPYIERFHAHITSKATVGAGEAAPSVQPTNS